MIGGGFEIEWLIFWNPGWLVLWSPGAAGAFLWRPPGCPYSGQRQAEALGRPRGGVWTGKGGTQGLNYWKEWADLLPRTNPFHYTCNSQFATLAALEVRGWVGYWVAVDEQMITNGGGQQQPHWCNTFQDIIGTVGAPDQETIMGNMSIIGISIMIIFKYYWYEYYWCRSTRPRHHYGHKNLKCSCSENLSSLRWNHCQWKIDHLIFIISKKGKQAIVFSRRVYIKIQTKFPIRNHS